MKLITTYQCDVCYSSLLQPFLRSLKEEITDLVVAQPVEVELFSLFSPFALQVIII